MCLTTSKATTHLESFFLDSADHRQHSHTFLDSCRQYTGVSHEINEGGLLSVAAWVGAVVMEEMILLYPRVSASKDRRVSKSS